MDRHVLHEDVIGSAVSSLRASIYVTWMGAIVSYDPKSRTASVQPMQNDPRDDVDTGAVVSEPWPVLHGVPVAWPRFGGFMIVGNLNPGDAVTLQAFDLDPTTVIRQGRSQSPIDVAYVRRLSGNFWRIIPDDIVSPASDVPGSGVTIMGLDGNSAQVRISSGSIQLGASASHPVSLSNLVDGNFSNIIQACTSAAGAAVPGDGGHAAFTAFAAALTSPGGTHPLGATGASVAKAQ